MNKFVCDKCGACCRQLQFFGNIYSELDSGNGVCIYLDRDTNSCTIYKDRPSICKIEHGYSVYFSDVNYDEYINITKKACALLKKNLEEN